MGKRISRLQRKKDQFRTALYTRDKEKVMRFIKEENHDNSQFSDLGLSALQMAVVWGYDQEVKATLKTGKQDDVAQHNDTVRIDDSARREPIRNCTENQTQDEYSRATQWPLPKCIQGELVPAQPSSHRKMVAERDMFLILEEPTANSLLQSGIETKVQFSPFPEQQNISSFQKAREEVRSDRISGLRSTVGSDCNATCYERSTLTESKYMRATQPTKFLSKVLLPQMYENPRKLTVQAGKSVELQMKELDESYEMSVYEEQL